MSTSAVIQPRVRCFRNCSAGNNNGGEAGARPLQTCSNLIFFVSNFHHPLYHTNDVGGSLFPAIDEDAPSPTEPNLAFYHHDGLDLGTYGGQPEENISDHGTGDSIDLDLDEEEFSSSSSRDHEEEVSRSCSGDDEEEPPSPSSGDKESSNSSPHDHEEESSRSSPGDHEEASPSSSSQR